MPNHTHIENEEWRPIPGFEKTHEASSLGRVRSLDRVMLRRNGVSNFCKGQILSETWARGYARVSMGRAIGQVLAHRLICSAFHGEPREGQYARHLNGDPADNRPENLAWGSQSDNMRDMAIHERTNTTKLTADQVFEVKRRLATGETQVSIARSFGVVPSTIGWIKRGSTWKHVQA